MSAFGGLVLTNKGRNLQAKAQAGTNLVFTRIAIGDGALGGTSIVELNSLINETLSLSIITLKALSEGQAVVGAVLSNTGIVSGFYFKEVGVFATDPDIGEILYCYGNAGETADYIPAGGGADIIEKTINITTIVGNAPNVSAVINESLNFVPYGTYTTDMGNKVDKVIGKGLSTNDYTTTEKDKLAGIASGANNYTHPSSHSLDVITETAAKKILTLDERNKLSNLPSDTNAQLADIKYLPNTGTADAILVNKTGFTLADGNYVEFKTTALNTTAVTLNATSTGVKDLRATDGTVLASGDLEIGFHKAIFDGVQGFFVLAPSGGGIPINDTIEKLYQISSSSGAINKGDVVHLDKSGNITKDPINVFEYEYDSKYGYASTPGGSTLNLPDTRKIGYGRSLKVVITSSSLIVSMNYVDEFGVLQKDASPITIDTTAGHTMSSVDLISDTLAMITVNYASNQGRIYYAIVEIGATTLTSKLGLTYTGIDLGSSNYSQGLVLGIDNNQGILILNDSDSNLVQYRFFDINPTTYAITLGATMPTLHTLTGLGLGLSGHVLDLVNKTAIITIRDSGVLKFMGITWDYGADTVTEIGSDTYSTGENSQIDSFGLFTKDKTRVVVSGITGTGSCYMRLISITPTTYTAHATIIDSSETAGTGGLINDDIAIMFFWDGTSDDISIQLVTVGATTLVKLGAIVNINTNDTSVSKVSFVSYPEVGIGNATMDVGGYALTYNPVTQFVGVAKENGTASQTITIHAFN